jgi:membrane protein YqaA with SNARE-associated domain
VTGYIGLFLAALIAATILPAQSETALVLMIANGGYSVLGLVAVASIGNVLGSVINWFLGLYVERFKSHRWFCGHGPP